MAVLLEQDIDALEALDGQRDRCRDLLESGARSLVAWATAEKPDDDWESAPGDDVERALVLRALNFVNRQSLVKADLVEANKKLRDALLRTTLEGLYKEWDRRDESSSYKDRLPIFRACEIIEALVEDEDESTGPFCKATFACLYRVITEIYRVREPEWKVGGVRASEKASQTAFATREAVRAILLVRESLVNTALLLQELGEAKKSWGSSQDAPPLWRTQNSGLRLRSLQTSLITRWPHLLNRKMMEDVASPTDDWTIQACKEITKQLTAQRNKLSVSIDAMPSADKTDAMPSADKTELFSSDANTRLRDSLDKIFVGLLGKADQLLKEPGPQDKLALGDERAPKDEPLIVFRLNDAAAKLLRGLYPTKVYLETALTAELAAGPNRAAVPPDAAEASFAAAGLGEIARASGSYDRDDLRLHATAQLALSQLSERGTLPSRTPFDVFGFGYRLPPQGAEAIRAVCDMLRFSSTDCDPETARKLVRYFLETRADRPLKDAGWHSDAEPSKENGEVWVTALAFFALLDLRRMLDTEINRRVLRYFTKREPKELNVGLGQLFLPDTALALRSSEKSIGAQLYNMRAHVEGDASVASDFSVVLYGPPGTGKTTLAEAVAKSSGSVLVEITPSDILIGGREQIERQTRVVFSALAMLTQSVILFDEFDSILRTREQDKGGQITSEFQFLTPGLLPKLKRLHDRAAKQRLAYVLATNYVGEIDDAAIRSGRFDSRLGIFPPDLLSRVGRLATEMWSYEPGVTSNQEQAKRAIEVIKKTAGHGMATLGKPGWFTAPRRGKSLEETLFGYIYQRGQEKMPEWGSPEADIRKYEAYDEDPKIAQQQWEHPNIAQQQWEQWDFVQNLDTHGGKLGASDWKTYIGLVDALAKKAAATKRPVTYPKRPASALSP